MSMYTSWTQPGCKSRDSLDLSSWSAAKLTLRQSVVPLLLLVVLFVSASGFSPDKFASGFAQDGLSSVVGVAVDSEIGRAQTPTQDLEQEQADVSAEGPQKISLGGYELEIRTSLACTPVTSQGSTGTCWSFSTASFLESELMRQGYPPIRLSAMYLVRQVYLDKARNYVLRQGKANFGEGALAHDFINMADRHGLVPEVIYPGTDRLGRRHDHQEMVAVLTGIVESVVKLERPSPRWQMVMQRVLDTYLGEVPQEFEFQGQVHTPGSFATRLNFDRQDYVSLTSYMHHPFYDSFVLEIPDNHSSGRFLNLPIDELMMVMDKALDQGYTFVWDGDVSEPTFSSKQGLAVLPKSGQEEALHRPEPELEVTQEMRQETFFNYETTDDHLMHVTGVAVDQDGRRYYIVKNSWGDVGPVNGFLYMSEAYARLKTVSILVHRDVLDGLP